MTQFSYTIQDELGLHARPAGLLAKEAASFGAFPSKNRSTFPIQELGKLYENQEVL